MIADVLWLIFSMFMVFGFLIFVFNDTGKSENSGLNILKFFLKLVVAAIVSVICLILISKNLVSILVEIDRNNMESMVKIASTFFTVLVAAFGYIYTKRQDKVQAIHAESGWRKNLLDLEAETTYSIEHLIKLNAFINPVNNDKNSIDCYVNQIILGILENHDIPSCIKRISVDCNTSNYPNNIEKILGRNREVNIFDYNIEERKKKEVLSPMEQNELRRCIHALLKNDWDNITGKAK